MFQTFIIYEMRTKECEQEVLEGKRFEHLFRKIFDVVNGKCRLQQFVS